MVAIKQNERIEDLQYEGLRIIQSDNGYRFTTDAVLLANFVGRCKGKKVAELGSGSGVISILVAKKRCPRQVIGIELQPVLADMSRRSVELNNLSDIISIVNADMLEYSDNASFDVVISNPPYRKIGSGDKQELGELAIARHEVKITLEQVITTAGRLLNNKGAFYLVHQAERLGEIFAILSQHNLQPKELCLVRPRIDATPNLVLVKSVKCGGVGLQFLPDIIVFDEYGNYTTTVKQLYGE